MQRQSIDNPMTAKDYVKAGDACYEQKNYSEAIADYTKAIELDPQCALAYHNRGMVYYNQGNYAAAIADYTKVIVELDPKCAAAYHNRGIAYIKQSNDAAATADFCQAMILLDCQKQTKYFSWHQKLIDHIKNIVRFKEYALNYITLLPSSHDIIKKILTPGTTLHQAFNVTCRGERAGEAEIIVARVARALSQYCKEATAQDAVFLFFNSVAIRQVVCEARTVDVIQSYVELLDACMLRGINILDFVEQPLKVGSKYNTASVVAYFKDRQLLSAYAALLKHCTESEENKKRVGAFLEKTIVGFTIFNVGGGMTLAELFKKQGITDLPVVTSAVTPPVIAIQPITVEAPAFSTAVILQSTLSEERSPSSQLEPIYISGSDLKAIRDTQTEMPAKSAYQSALLHSVRS